MSANEMDNLQRLSEENRKWYARLRAMQHERLMRARTAKQTVRSEDETLLRLENLRREYDHGMLTLREYNEECDKLT